MKLLPPTQENIALAAEALRSGKLIGLPTETVYGIGVNALDSEAVKRVFQLKGRPAENPLIVHVAESDEVGLTARDLPSCAQTLIDGFWPGPLTLVLLKRPEVPDVVTAGQDTVAVRCPGHPVARAIISVAGVPVAAPSANRFMSLSPTRAQDIDEKISEGLELIIDAGPCEVGIESTVLDCTGPTPVLLRPGGISAELIRTRTGIEVETRGSGGVKRAPGMYARHYAPTTMIQLVEQLRPTAAGITFREPSSERQIRLPEDPAEYARLLYATLNRLDQIGAQNLEIEMPPETPEWEAIWDRLRKASSKPRPYS